MEIIEEKNRVVLVENGTEAGEMTWSNKGDDNLVIDHTYVNEAYRGLGYAEKLVFAGVEIARRDGKKIIPLCPFAKKNSQDINPMKMS